MLNELRYALRQMLRRPGWTALAVGVLGLAIGASAAVFALVDGVLFRPIAAHEPERLVRIFAADELRQGAMIVVAGLSLGLAVAFAATRGVEAMLYGIGARDAASFAFAATLLALVALLAVLVPARQAARIDPQRSLRAE